MKRSHIIIGFAALVVVLAVIIYSVLISGGDGARVAAPPDELAGGQIVDTGDVHFYTEWPFDVGEAKRRQVETAEALGIPVEKTIDLGEGVTLEMVLIPAGEFVMGSPGNEEGRYNDEGPQRRVRITKPFYLGKYEVTQAQYERVMEKNPSSLKGANLPVDGIPWNGAQEFIGKAGNDLRLPTEAEWEYACRAGRSTRFHSGDRDSDLDAVGWYGRNSNESMSPAGQKGPNSWGIYDMHGNVWEWCSDWYQDSYRRLEMTNPTGPHTGKLRVLRGGAWVQRSEDCRSARRYTYDPDNRFTYDCLGFRVVSPAR